MNGAKEWSETGTGEAAEGGDDAAVEEGEREGEREDWRYKGSWLSGCINCCRGGED